MRVAQTGGAGPSLCGVPFRDVHTGAPGGYTTTCGAEPRSREALQPNLCHHIRIIEKINCHAEGM